MRIFYRDYKVNFVDNNDTYVGFDWESSCCENFAYWFGYQPGDKSAKAEQNLESYRFDRTYFEQRREECEWEEENLAIFKLLSDELPPIYLTLSNVHNGYYAHGFSMEVGGTTIRDGYL